MASMKNLLWILVCTTFFSCNKNPSTPDIDTGLTAFISLAGNQAYNNTTGQTGTAHNTKDTTNYRGEKSRAIYFNRADSAYIDMGDLAGASFTNNIFTISCWVMAADTAHNISILSKRNPLGVFEYSLDNHFGHTSFKLDNWVVNGGATVYGVDPLNTKVNIRPGVWQHIAFVADGNTMKVYVNSVLNAESDLHQSGNSFTDTDAHFMIGNGGGFGANNYFNGAIGDIHLYNRALDVAAIHFLYSL